MIFLKRGKTGQLANESLLYFGYCARILKIFENHDVELNYINNKKWGEYCVLLCWY